MPRRLEHDKPQETMMERASDKLMEDLRAVVDDAEELLKATASQTGERIEKVRARAEESVRNARARIQSERSELENRVRENPWTSVGIAAGIGLLVGIVLGRK
jgi:ElaB/YqjD/DUF883 family membrane-anchored ribosome-binding protein